MRKFKDKVSCIKFNSIKHLCGFLILLKLTSYILNNNNRHQREVGPYIVELQCGTVNLKDSANLFEVEDRLSCKNNKAKAGLSEQVPSLSYLLCHSTDSSSSFESISGHEAIQSSRTFPSCDFSSWLKNISLEISLTTAFECRGSIMYDRPFENCEIYNVRFENKSLIGVSNSTTFDFQNLISIERRSRRQYGGIKEINSRLKNGKAPTMKLPMKLVAINKVNQICSSRLRGTTILIYRWHPDSFFHLIESLFRLYKTMKFHDLLDIPTRIVNLDPFAGTQTIFMGNVLKRSGLNSSGHYKYAALLQAFGDSIYHMDMFQGPVCFDHVIVVGFSTHSLGVFENLKNDTSLIEFREFLLRKFSIQNNQKAQQITIMSRSNILGYDEMYLSNASRRRHILNENQIALYLREKTGKKVEIVKMNELSVHAQVSLIFRTQILISVHSAALINILWMRPGSAVVQIHVEGTHLGSIQMLKRNHLLVKECGIPFHMTTHVEAIASSLKLGYGEIFVGGSESRKNRALKLCEERKKLTYGCCERYEEEDHLHRFAIDFVVDKEKVFEITKTLLQNRLESSIEN